MIILGFNGILLSQSDIAKTNNLDTLYHILHAAQIEKDSQIIGLAARKIASVKEWVHRDQDSEILKLITLSINCFAASGDSVNYYGSPQCPGYFLHGF